MKKPLLILIVITAAIAVQAVTVKLKLLNCPGEVHLSGPLHAWYGVQNDNLNASWVSNLVTFYTNGEAYYTIPRITNKCFIDLRFPNICVWHKRAYPGGWTNAYLWDDASPPHTNWLTIGSNYVGASWTVTASGGTFTVTTNLLIGINAASVGEPNRPILTYGAQDVHPRQITVDSDPNGRFVVWWQTNVAGTYTSNTASVRILDRQGHATLGVSDNSSLWQAWYNGVLTWTNQFP